ncbi:MAG TPA: hypothetical protein PLQ76_04785, partial [bacterium]|nr:hypothetical protein [bacterium]
MKAALTYAPFVWPSSPPLGISLLKSYASEFFPSASVTTLDLNADFFSGDAEKFKGLCGVCPYRSSCDNIPPEFFFENGMMERCRT